MYFVAIMTDSSSPSSVQTKKTFKDLLVKQEKIGKNLIRLDLFTGLTLVVIMDSDNQREW